MENLNVNNRKQKLDNIINKITEGQLSKIREAANVAFDNACIHNQDTTFSTHASQEQDPEMDKAKSDQKDEEVGHSTPDGAGPSSGQPAPTDHGADM